MQLVFGDVEHGAVRHDQRAGVSSGPSCNSQRGPHEREGEESYAPDLWVKVERVRPPVPRCERQVEGCTKGGAGAQAQDDEVGCFELAAVS